MFCNMVKALRHIELTIGANFLEVIKVTKRHTVAISSKTRRREIYLISRRCSMRRQFEGGV